jgi:hypothetical protein
MGRRAWDVRWVEVLVKGGQQIYWKYDWGVESKS